MIIRHPNGRRRSEPVILAFDTTLAHCSAALFHDALIAHKTEAMARGQAERLMPLLEELLSVEQISWQDIELIAVGVGPGNFTGIRISVAAARGLGLALGIPVMGVSMFEAIRDPEGPFAGPSEIVSLQAPRDQVYLQHFRYGRATAAPTLLDLNALPQDLQFPVNTRVLGFAAQQLCHAGHASGWEEIAPSEIAPRLARRADARWHQGERDFGRPKPLYVKAADAAPSRTPAPVILP